MKRFLLVTSFIAIYLVCFLPSYGQMTVQSVDITQVDTFALRGYKAQPILKIHVSITGTGGNISFQKLVVNSLNQLNTDIDSIAIYQTPTNRFSLVEYPGEAILMTARKKLTADSAVFNMNYPLETGDNYIWVTMDVSKNARASHTLDAAIKQNGILIDGNYYPAVYTSPANSVAISEVYYTENFESFNSSNEPIGWTQLINCGGCTVPPRWIGSVGGYKLGNNAGNPIAPKSGKKNVMFERENYTPSTGMLISKALDLSLAGKPMLTFYHSQVAWCKDQYCTQSNNDELRVYYKIGTAGTWNLLSTYTLATPNSWVKREILLPDAAAQQNLYLGFQGTAQYGWGVCLDSLVMYETVVLPREVKSVVVAQPQTGIVPQGSNHNPIMRVDVRVKGNNGTMTLDSLTVTAANTVNADVKTNGVSLYTTLDSVYLSPTLCGTATSINNGKIRFKGLNKVLETGENYYWVTYDVSKTATPGDTLDAKILAGDIHLSTGGPYPATDQSPAGSRLIKQSVFIDDFETDKLWALTGEFQRGKPQGLGGLKKGNPDPTQAYSDSTVLGTDLSGLGANLGDYEPNLTSGTAYTATSPLIDGRYFKNLNLWFYRQLNVGNQDSAIIEYQVLGQSNKWNLLWTNFPNTIADRNWNSQNINISDSLDRKQFYLRFRMGPTGPIDVYSGWNIDYLFITGDTIRKDAALTTYYGPVSSCDLSSNEFIKVAVKNTGPGAITNLPVKFSIDNGKTYVTNTISGTLNVDQSQDYTFNSPVNLSKAAIYNVIVKIGLTDDDYSKNDSVIQNITSYPNYSLPYNTGFEEDTSFWISGGLKSSWNRGWPMGTHIISPAGGSNCWKTDSSGWHRRFENSYVESPCFSFTDKEVPMIEMKASFSTAPTDGAILQYSLDKGVSWQYVSRDTLTSVPWRWYNDTVTTLKKRGWNGQSADSNTQQWWDERQLLPSAVALQNKVKFRIVFKSDSSLLSPYAGFAFDDVKIYNAPFDIGVKEFVGLNTPSCQNENNPYVKVAIKNYGLRTMQVNDTIIVGIKVNGGPALIDTFKVNSNLARNDTVHYRMKKPINIASAGDYNISAFTLIEKDPYFYHTVSNDSAFISLHVNPNPVTGLSDTVYSAIIDTLVIQANNPGTYNYSWTYPPNPAYTNYTSYLEVKNTGGGKHYLTVTDQNTSCVTKDSVFVKILVSDVGVSKIVSPVNNCGYGTNFYPTIKITNYGTDTLRANRKIPVNLQLDSNPVQKDTIILQSSFAPKDTIQVVLNTSMDLSAPAIYNLKVYTSLQSDTTHSNDSHSASFEIYGYPSIDLGADVYAKALSYTIHPQTGFNTYLWNDNSTADTLKVTTSGKYLVTITDINHCPAKDSMNVHLAIHDLGVKRLISPLSSCTLPDSSIITCKLVNFGTDTIQAGDTAIIKYTINAGVPVSEKLTFASNLNPNDSLTFAFFKKAGLSAVGNYDININSLLYQDLRSNNDTVNTTISVFGNPSIDLGPIRNEQAYEYTIRPGNGFSSYKWQDNSTDSVYIITKTHYETSRTYWVTVTDQHNCSTADTTTIFLVDQDLQITDVILPGNSCTLTNSENIGIKIANVGNQALSNRLVTLQYQVNNNTPVVESYTFTGAINASVIYTFTTKADLSAIGNYKVLASIKMSGDVQPNNDTLTNFIQDLGSPQIDFGAVSDTLKVNTLPYTLDAGAGAGYIYNWSNSATTQTTDASADGWYSVTVTNQPGCQTSKSVYVQKNRSDLSVVGFTVPATGCTFPADQTIGIKLVNTGNMALLNKPGTITYQINTGAIVSQDVSFTGNPKDTLTFIFTQTADLSATGTYEFTLTCNYTEDADASNNSKDFEVIHYVLPTINFADAVNDTIKGNSFPVTLDPGAGFSSYLWNDGSKTATYPASKNGTYTVTVTDANHCQNHDSVYVDIETLVKQVNEDAELSIYPNPVHDLLYIDLNLKRNFGDAITLEVYTNKGKLVLSRTLKGSASYREIIEVNTLPKGLYYIRIYQKDWVSTDKIIVQ